MIELTVTDDDGATDTDAVVVTVREIPPPPPPDPPAAEATIDVSGPTAIPRGDFASYDVAFTNTGPGRDAPTRRAR